MEHGIMKFFQKPLHRRIHIIPTFFERLDQMGETSNFYAANRFAAVIGLFVLCDQCGGKILK